MKTLRVKYSFYESYWRSFGAKRSVFATTRQEADSSAMLRNGKSKSRYFQFTEVEGIHSQFGITFIRFVFSKFVKTGA